jgi:hypothetical protein
LAEICLCAAPARVFVTAMRMEKRPGREMELPTGGAAAGGVRAELKKRQQKVADAFVEEVDIWLSLHHPNLVPLLGYTTAPSLMLVSELLRGGSLDRQLVRQAFPSMMRFILTEIYLCHACSCRERLRVETPGQYLERWRPSPRQLRKIALDVARGGHYLHTHFCMAADGESSGHLTEAPCSPFTSDCQRCGSPRRLNQMTACDRPGRGGGGGRRPRPPPRHPPRHQVREPAAGGGAHGPPLRRLRQDRGLRAEQGQAGGRGEQPRHPEDDGLWIDALDGAGDPGESSGHLTEAPCSPFPSDCQRCGSPRRLNQMEY